MDSNLANKADLTRVQTTLKEDFAQLRTDFTRLEAKLDRLCETLTWHFFIIIAAWTVCLLAVIKYMLNA